ncbi:MAG TPA: UDP-N-acetylmuramoyl-L-alanine--D-glutamate ligase [Actinomycetes bacterium]
MTGVDLAGSRVCVAGLGVAGTSAARALAGLGADVVTADRRDGTDQALPAGTDLVVASPGWRPDQPLLAAAAAAGVPVWGDVELAWRLRRTGAPWLGVTGTNGKTTTVRMLESILRTAGYRAVACGNVGLPVLDAVLADEPYDVLAVEVSSFQLHWTQTVEFRAAAVLNIAPDHLDWHGSMEAYTAAKATVWRGGGLVVANADDPLVSRLAVATGRADRVGVTLSEPVAGRLGVRGGYLVDRAWGAAHQLVSSAAAGVGQTPGLDADGTVLAEVSDVQPPAPHNVSNALAAAALARALGVDAPAVREGLRTFSPGAHRIAHVATVGGVDYVDDSKATNPHAAAASLRAFGDVVWVAGGLAKGARFEELVAGAADRLRAAVLVGQDRALVAEALARHAPEVPVVEVTRTDTGAMDDVVHAAAGLARPGDTVLLAPACASMDMFRDYAARGDAFADAVHRLPS